MSIQENLGRYYTYCGRVQGLREAYRFLEGQGKCIPEGVKTKLVHLISFVRNEGAERVGCEPTSFDREKLPTDPA